MTFTLYYKGGKGASFLSIIRAQQAARAMIIGDKRIDAVEIRPSCSRYDGRFATGHPGSFYKTR